MDKVVNWIPVKEGLPEPKFWCHVWVEDKGKDGLKRCYIDKMYLNSKNQWVKELSKETIVIYTSQIKAWQPYYGLHSYKK